VLEAHDLDASYADCTALQGVTCRVEEAHRRPWRAQRGGQEHIPPAGRRAAGAVWRSGHGRRAPCRLAGGPGPHVVPARRARPVRRPQPERAPRVRGPPPRCRRLGGTGRRAARPPRPGRPGRRPALRLQPRHCQKASIALAFVRPFGVLLADEPFDGLDPPSREALDELVAEAGAGGAAVLLATHRIEVVEQPTAAWPSRMAGSSTTAPPRSPACCPPERGVVDTGIRRVGHVSLQVLGACQPAVCRGA